MWLENVFKTVLHLSFTGSFVILLVLLARVFLCRVPKIYSYILWAVVFFRLLCPITFTSDISILPQVLAEPENAVEEIWRTTGNAHSNEAIVESRMEEKRVESEGVLGVYTSPIERVETEGVIETYTKPLGSPEISISYPIMSRESNSSLRSMQVVSTLWFLGVLGWGVYSAITLRKLNQKLSAAVCLKENIYICDYIETPFTLGMVLPKIYLPSVLEPAEMEYIIAHEKHHIRRFDHIVKPMAYITLCIHWFNPLVWLSFVLAGKDMEMSCDEAVMAKADEDIRAAYSQSLLRLSTGRRIAIAPLAFGEGNVKARIKNVMNYKKPTFWVVLVSVVVCVLWGIALGSNPETEEENTTSESSMQGEIASTEEPVKAPTEEPIGEAQMHEVTVWQKKVDYNGDGVEDTVSFVMQVDDAYEEFRGITDGYELLRAPFVGNVECVDGANGEQNFTSANISHDRLGNYQISYAEIDGNHYMITTEIGEQMGSGYYSYEVFCLTTQEPVDSYEIHFVTAGDDFRARPTDKYRQEVVPQFKEKLERWTSDAMLIVATDVNERAEDGIIVSSFETTYEASYYYDLVWERMLDEKVRVDNCGLKVNLPEDEGWIQNPQYLLSGYPVAHIKYYDAKVDAPVLLRYGKMDPLDLAYLHGMEFEEEFQTVWYAEESSGPVEILCQVSGAASEEGKKTVLVSWTYEALNYVIFGELPEDADETILAKTAVYVTEHFETYERWEEKIIPVTERSFDTKYYSFELPEELVGKVSYQETQFGKFVTFYHTATLENYEYGGVLGMVMLQNQEDALSSIGMNGRYIGEACFDIPEAEVCLITTPTDVEWEIGSPQEEEFLELAAIFESKQFPGYVTLKGADHEAALTKIAQLGYDMGYVEIGSQGQTILGNLNGGNYDDIISYSYDRRVADHYFDSGSGVKLTINGTSYTYPEDNYVVLNGVDFNGLYSYPFGIFDLDKEDMYQELLVVSKDYDKQIWLYVFRYDIGELTCLGEIQSLYSDTSFRVDEEGILTVTLEDGSEVAYKLENNKLKMRIRP